MESEEDDVMVTCELEAAEALADMARSSTGESDPPPTHHSVPTSPEDQTTSVQEYCGNTSTMMQSIPANPEGNTETDTIHVYSTSVPGNLASKSRQNLTEAEKEARRLRRVLANRESARQTIRRRQDMHVELTRKAADLLVENENLKKEKETALKEYNSLKTKNEHLKQQMAHMMKSEAGEFQETSQSTQAETSTAPSTMAPIFMCNQPPILPILWPTMFPPSDAFRSQHMSGSDIASTPQFPMQLREMCCAHHRQEDPTRTSKAEPSFVLLPVRWLVPFPHSGAPQSQLGFVDRQNELSQAPQSSALPPSDSVVDAGNNLVSTNQEVSNPTETATIGRLNGMKTSFQSDGSDQHIVSQSQGTSFSPPPRGCMKPAARPQVDSNSGVRSTSLPFDHMSENSLEKRKEPIMWPSKKPENAIAAAEARRRRRELIKLKSFRCYYDRTQA